MGPPPVPESLPEPQLNELLREVDWRFLLGGAEPRRAIAIGKRRRGSRALRLITTESPVPGSADLALIGYPSQSSLREALEALAPGGAVVCLWRAPRPGGTRRARERLRAAGFTDARLYWTGPIPFRQPEFWLPLDSAEASAHLLTQRPARSRTQAALRPLWKAVSRAGLLAPICAVGHAPGGEAGADEADDLLGAGRPMLLLTGGKRSINKVVGLPFAPGQPGPATVVKFSRVTAADTALEHEAEVLRRVESEHPAVAGVPRLRASGRRAGRRAIAETAVFGPPLISQLGQASFERLGTLVAEWLAGLVGQAPLPESSWRGRLVDEPLEDFERNFGDVAATGTVARVRRLLSDFGDLPQACEHRDCSPWNVVLVENAPALLDWESAEPRGLPGLDLAYFLANAAFVVEGALDSGRTRESYARLLDPSSPTGAVAARCAAAHCERIGLDPGTYERLRLLGWVVHSRSDFRHLEMAAASAPSADARRGGMFLGMVEEELRRQAPAGGSGIA
jgi:hypothetical protein